jgi:hypothetical protein
MDTWLWVGCVRTQEYLAICEEYGVEVTDDDLKNVLAIADEDGEVRRIQI